jgi:iron complex transport system permease protein
LSETRRRRATFLALGALLPVCAAVAIAVGSVTLPLEGVVTSLAQAAGLGTSRLEPVGETILWNVRLPRVLLAAVVGGGLAVVGACLQSVFRNPMADSGLLGVSGGAALGAVLAIRLGWASEVFLALALAAFAGAMAAVLTVYALAHAAGRPSLHGLLLTGLAVSALAGAGTSVLLVATDEFRVKTVLFWLAGGLEGRGVVHLQLGAAFVLTGCALLVALSRPLDVLSLGTDEAAALGLAVSRTRLLLLGLAALVAGACTAVAGSVPFVGLVAPHALRPLVGPRGRHLLPAAFLGGAVLVVLADLLSRTTSSRIDLPLGALTAFVGAPYFLLALRHGGERT